MLSGPDPRSKWVCSLPPYGSYFCSLKIAEYRTAVPLVLASGVAWAVTKIGTDDPDTLRGTLEDDNLVGKGGTTCSLPCVAETTCWAVRARIGFSAATNASPSEATRTWREDPATMEFAAA
jgi:hypothetical protein